MDCPDIKGLSAPDLALNVMNTAEFAMQTDGMGWQGRLDLVYDVKDGKTQVSRSFAQAPLKIQRPFYPEGAAVCHSTILHTAGGIVGGDRLAQSIHLQAESQTLITTATPGRVYRSPDKISEQTIHISLESQSILEWLPQELIIFNGANYRQRMRIELAPNASFLGWEITRLGRTARGECFEQGEVRSQIEIWREGQPLWIDRQRLQGGDDLIQSPNGLARNAVIATFIYLGQSITTQTRDRARESWVMGNYRGEGRITQTLGGGLLGRYRGQSTAEARRWFTEIWRILRPIYGQPTITIPRVWQ